jgi:hypothetical protein
MLQMKMWSLALGLLLLACVSAEVVTFQNCPVSGELLECGE